MSEPIPIRVIVKLETSYWSDQRAIHIRRDLRYLQRKCSGHNFVDEDARCGGVKEVITRILNLEECEDGVYQVVTCNERKDWETGNIEDWDYRLIPFDEQKVVNNPEEKHILTI